jgi:hypothetical protein
MSGELRLTPLERIPGRRVLAWHDDALYASERYVLWRWDYAGRRWTRVARYRPDWTRVLSSATRLGGRLRRDGFHALAVLPDGGLAAILPKAIALCAPGETEFRETWRVRRGTRPMSLAVAPGGAIYWGEYFDNATRAEVHVYGSHDLGRTWDVVYTFPAGAIRHVHGIVHDPHQECLWMCTGDYESEPRILRVSLDWKSVETVLSSSQQTRTVRPIPAPDGLYFATDTEREQNYIYRLDPKGELHRLHPTNGPSLWSCQAGDSLFFTTDVEPSPVNHRRSACLYGSSDGGAWTELMAWPKDRWHMFLFQFGNIILPTGRNTTPVLAATGSAVRGEDGVLHAWSVSTA